MAKSIKEKAEKQSVDNELKATLSEYNMLREEMRMFLEFHRRDTQIFGGILGGLVSIYLSNSTIFNINILTIIIPSLIFLYYSFQIYNFHMVSVEAKACARIEQRINLLLNRTVMDWESVIAKQNVRGAGSPAPMATVAIMLLFLFIFIVFSLKALDTYGVMSLIFHGIELIIIILATVLWVLFETKSRLPKV